MLNLINLGNNVFTAFLFSFIGLIVFAVGYYVFDRLTPYNLWREILEKNNLALAVVVGAVCIGISLIIAAAIHG